VLALSLLDGPHSVSDLMEALSMEQSAVSHQLRVLREHRLVRAEKAGRRRLYTLYDQHVGALLQAGLDHVRRKHQAADEGDRGFRSPGQTAGAVS
jgi:DNA-binding transcriptional ArsR family regulator